MHNNIHLPKYFHKIGNGKVQCKLCKNIYSASSTMQNLKIHLFTKHLKELGLLKKPLPGITQKVTSRSVLWTYFSKLEGDDLLSTCNLCGKILSYNSTVTNLKMHLSRCHTEAFFQYLQNIPLIDNNKESVHSTSLQDTNNADDSDESEHISSEIWNYFEQETGGRVRCVVCRESKPNNIEDLKTHMEENHPKLLQAVGLAQENTTSDQGSVKDDDGAYTEVIYLEEDVKKSPTKPKYLYKTEENIKNVKRPSDSHRRVNSMKDKKRRVSSSSDDTPLLRKNKESNELDTFMTYIKCLLKQLPKDTCAKLQMDIVNLIMNVKLNKTNDNSLDISNISLKIPVNSNYVTVSEDVSNKTNAEADSNRAETSNNSFNMFAESNTRNQNDMTVDN